MKRQIEHGANTASDELSRAQELIEHYKPEFLGEGGNNIVFAIPKHPRVVVKMDKGLRAKIQSYLQEKQLSEPDEGLRHHAQTYIQEYASRVKELATFFPPLSILRERIFLAKIPLPGNRTETGKREVEPRLGWGIVRVQEKIPDGADQVVSLHSPYPERRKPEQRNSERYSRVTEALSRGADPAKEDIAWIQPNLQYYLNRAGVDHVFRSALTDFVERAVQYTEKTGQILDLVGMDNLVLLHAADKNAWRFVLVDVLPSRPFTIREAEEAFDRFRQTGEWNPELYSKVLNALHWARCINGLASGLGLKMRIQALTGFTRLTADEKARLYNNLHVT